MTVAASNPPRRALVVDDNEDAAELVSMLVTILGFDTRRAHRASDALAIAERFEPDVALLDIGLPDLSGHELATLLRARLARPLRIIAITGWARDEDRVRAARAGFDAYALKPIDRDRLAMLLCSDARS